MRQVVRDRVCRDQPTGVSEMAPGVRRMEHGASVARYGCGSIINVMDRPTLVTPHGSSSSRRKKSENCRTVASLIWL